MKTTGKFICRWLYRAVLLNKWHICVSAVLLCLHKSVLIIQQSLRGFIGKRLMRRRRSEICDNLMRDCKSIIEERNTNSSLFIHSDHSVDLTCSTPIVRRRILENCAQQFGLSYTSQKISSFNGNSSTGTNNNSQHCVEYVRDDKQYYFLLL